jgi:hypothetical protein
VIAEPPVDDGAVQDTTAWVLPETPDTAVGAPGTVAGVTADETAELQPTLFVALTVNVYEAPFVSPVTVHEVVEVEQSDGAAPIGTIR